MNQQIELGREILGHAIDHMKAHATRNGDVLNYDDEADWDAVAMLIQRKSELARTFVTFRELSIGQSFDWINDDNRIMNSFYLRCTKISARKYRDENGVEYRVGSIDARVFHVGQ